MGRELSASPLSPVLERTRRPSQSIASVFLNAGAAVGGFNCVHLMFPAVHGAVGPVAAGCHDSCIYMWRRRSTRETGDQARNMRDNVVYYVLEGHKVHTH